MTFLNCSYDSEAEQVEQMFERQTRAFGYLPNYVLPFVHRPELMSHWIDLQKGIRKNMDDHLYELVTFAAAVELGSSYCALAHGRHLLSYYSSRNISDLAEGNYQGIVSEAEEAAMRYARKVAGTASAITPEDVNQLLANGFSDAEVFDIAATAAARAFFAKLVDGVGTQPDKQFANLDPDMLVSLQVGRRIER